MDGNESKQEYKTKIIPELHKQLGYKSVMAVPRLLKVSLNMGVGQATTDKKILDYAVGDLEKIVKNQWLLCPDVLRLVSKSGKAAYWRQSNIENDSMFQFLERFIYIACPKIRDFRGFSVKAFDGQGNFNIGIKEQIILTK